MTDTPRKRTPRTGVAGAMEIAGRARAEDIEMMRRVIKGEDGVPSIEQSIESEKCDHIKRLTALRRARDFAKIVATLSTFERDAVDAALKAREGEAS